MNSSPIRIILVDDHKMVRESWKMLLENNPRFQVVADCDNGFCAVELAKEFNPDIMVVDINMSPLNGFNITEKLMELMPGIKVIGFSVSNKSRYASRMLELGAKGYLTKTSPLEEIYEGIIVVHEGEFYICEEIKKHMSHTE
jgi:two-component system, NarL family, invasion response regulator UvrY